MVYDSQELAEGQIPIVEEQYKKNTGKEIKIKEVKKLKVNLPSVYSGKDSDHF